MIGEIYIDKNKDYWVSYNWLESNNITENTYSSWCQRDICERIYIESRAYIAYDTIPEQTRSKLPTKEEIKKEYNYARFQRLEISLTEELQAAYDSPRMAEYRRIIFEKYNIPIEQAVIFARKAAVIEQAIDIRNRWYSRIGVLEALYRAYLKIYPDSYSMKNRFCMTLTRAEDEGILSVAVNHKIFNKTEKKFGKLHEYWATVVLTHPRGFSVIDAYNIFCEACKDQNITTPSFGWFRIFRYNNLNLLEKGSLGKSVYEANNGLYAKIIPALHANSQWQIDGWRIPIYCKKRDEEGKLKPFITYTLFAVMDAHSRKIIGSWIAESENTETILKGLEDAVKNTLCLPYEIVSDNHSFNRTIEAASIKSDFEKMGVHWTVDHNPRRKSILERSFRTLGDKHFKRRYGYIGQGVKTKMKKGLTQQELLTIYEKPQNMLDFKQVVTITESVIYEYNNSVIKKLGDTPVNLYEKSEKPNAIPVNVFQRLALFIRKSEHKVIHGQITINRAGCTYEYQLPAEYSEKYNSKYVSVRYESFDCIYLFEKETDNEICSVSRKIGIHGALADQTEEDKLLLFKNSGRMKGVESKGKKKKENLCYEANDINPEAYGRISYLTASKDDLEIVRRNKHLSGLIVDKYDVNIDTVNSLPKIDEMLDSSLKPRQRDERSPYYVNSTRPMEKIFINEEGTPQM